MFPGGEYIRVFRTDYPAESISYTYISEDYLIDTFAQDQENPDVSQYAWAIGWWVNVDGHDYSADIMDTNKDLQVKDMTTVTFPNSSSFMGQFFNTHPIKLMSNGEVKTVTYNFSSANTVCPLISNQLPVDIDLSDIAIPGTHEWDPSEQYQVCDYMFPGAEYIRIFRTDYPAEAAGYTYISEDYLIDTFAQDQENPDVSQYAWAIGWWVNVDGHDYAADIMDTNKDLQVKTAVTVKAGFGFMGYFFDSHSLNVNFPSATSVPSKQ